RLTIPSATEVAIFATPPTDSWRYATRLRVPATLITAKNSNLAGPRFDRLARRHRMRRIELEGSHMFPLEQPRVTADAILEAIDAMGVR
ncbi:MAG: alpha/beta hydrolase, partial [Polyangiaceae bacterium]|nr:alpha/beta hydrolase [Polyangiaceae bacterium]